MRRSERPLSQVRTARTRAVVRTAVGEIDLGEDVGHVLRDRPARYHEGVGDRGVAAALGHQSEHIALRRRERRQRVSPSCHEQLGDHLGVQHRPACCDGAERVDERVQRHRHPVVEQVAGPGPPAATSSRRLPPPAQPHTAMSAPILRIVVLRPPSIRPASRSTMLGMKAD